MSGCTPYNAFEGSASSGTQPEDKKLRVASVTRNTNETKINLQLNIDGGALPQDDSNTTNGTESKSHAAQNSKAQSIDVDTGIGFLDHMLHALAKHAGWSLRLRTKGDLHSMHASGPTDIAQPVKSDH
jgi:imidazoleglycerol phosphate dehydratase HisB